jgi:hypothetical protein
MFSVNSVCDLVLSAAMNENNPPPQSLPPETKKRLFELARVLMGIHLRLAREAREKESLKASGPVDIKTAWEKTIWRDGLNEK